ncbi:MAG: phage major capsid protein [Planctomycetes bacterium]|nr:phage major capsid protein [Planctomycetota bacterium]
MAANLTTVADLLKLDYLPPIREQLENKNLLFSRWRRDNESVVGKQIVVPLHYGRNEGIGARPDGGTLPSAGRQTYKQMAFNVAYNYGRIKITGPLIASARSNEGAFARALTSEVSGMVTDLERDLEIQRFGAGTGVRAVCGTTNASATVVIGSGIWNLRVGMSVDIRAMADNVAIANGLATGITTVTPGTSAADQAVGAGTIVVDGGVVTTTSSHGVYRAGSVSATGPAYYEEMGLSGIVSATDPTASGLQGLAVASYPWWKATVLGNGGTARHLTLTMLDQLLDKVDQTGNGKISAFVMRHGIRRKIQALVSVNQRYMDTVKVKAGAEVPSYNNVPIFVSNLCPGRKIFAIDDTNHLSIYRMTGFEWMDKDGEMLHRVSGEDAYEAVLTVYETPGTDHRAAHALLDDLKENEET